MHINLFIYLFIYLSVYLSICYLFIALQFDVDVIVAQTNNAVANAIDAAEQLQGPNILRVISKSNFAMQVCR